MGFKRDTWAKWFNGIDIDIMYPRTHMDQVQVSLDDATSIHDHLNNKYVQLTSISDAGKFLIALTSNTDMRDFLNVYSKAEAELEFRLPTEQSINYINGLQAR